MTKLIPAHEARALSEKTRDDAHQAHIEFLTQTADKQIRACTGYRTSITIPMRITSRAIKEFRNTLSQLGYSTELTKTELRIIWE
jgi:hypothetical protein